MNANVSVTDSTIGLALTWPWLEPSPAHATRACTSNKLTAIALIATVRRDPLILVISNPSFKVLRERSSSIEQSGESRGANHKVRPHVVSANGSQGLKPSTRVFKKATMSSSSSGVKPSLPMVVFSLLGSSGIGQHVTFSTVPAGQCPDNTG